MVKKKKKHRLIREVGAHLKKNKLFHTVAGHFSNEKKKI